MITFDDRIVFSSKKEIISNYNKLSMSKFGCNSNIYSYSAEEIIKLCHKSLTSEKIELLEMFKSYDEVYYWNISEIIDVVLDVLLDSISLRMELSPVIDKILKKELNMVGDFKVVEKLLINKSYK